MTRIRPIVLLLGLFLTAGSAHAWGPKGHAAVGVLALEQLAPATHLALAEILGTDAPDAIAAWCNWPDDYRDTDGGQWTGPLHYINIAPDESSYLASRDCPGDRCNTAAIQAYARELGDKSLSRNARQQAFGFVCHFTGDLHQPLHAGYADDRGGNLIDVTWRGEEMNLHQFWDSHLIGSHAATWQELVDILRTRRDHQSHPAWQPGEVLAWTNESHALVNHFSYPATPVIDQEFAEQSWRVTQNQLATAAARLAALLDAVLADQ